VTPTIGRLALSLAAAALAGAFLCAGPAGATEPGARGPVTNLPIPRFVSMRAETANARRGPGLDHRVDWAFVHRGLPLEVTAEYGHWRRVRDRDGLGGWVHHSLLSGVRTGLVSAEAPVTVRAGPSGRTAVRALAEPGAIARIERCDADWCEIAAAGLRGWVPRDTLWGVQPGEVID